MKPENRVLLAFKNWEVKKSQLLPLLKAGTTDERILLKLQLEHLQQAGHRLREVIRPDEKPFMALLDSHIKRLQKQLYPNMIQRVLFRLKDYLFDAPAYLNRRRHQHAANMTNLKDLLRGRGLGSVAGELERHIDPDSSQLKLPLNCQLSSDKQLKFELHFGKDVYGDFQLKQLNGSLHQNGQTSRKYEFEIAEWPGLKANQALSLLEGRALKQPFKDILGQDSYRWVELGNDGVKHYATDHPFDVSSALKTMPNITRNRDELIRYLENGQQVPTHWKHDGHFQSIHVQADPGNNTLKIFDAKLRPVTAEQLNKIAQQQAKKSQVIALSPRKSLKNGQRIH
ncbi:hypothetical protein [Mucilaginibacter aquariorum]|uniref:Uncharacterized protein n=1 Tax=Mucilaginibacter aquariorum TaxID=2967225 RepID=A0ABT1T137_9SPHI|nr:hypothetical protein [Mucilaginibacter aquariorum]MCQ6958308.1 hypothetical protein [Mucilaginibacter aquariorum]